MLTAEQKALGADDDRAYDHKHKQDAHDLQSHLLSGSAGELSALRLDQRAALGYTLKALGCGMFGLASDLSFKDAILAVTREAGDADTNAAVCGAVFGGRIGYLALPRDWLRALPHKRWLDAKACAFLASLGFI